MPSRERSNSNRYANLAGDAEFSAWAGGSPIAIEAEDWPRSTSGPAFIPPADDHGAATGPPHTTASDIKPADWPDLFGLNTISDRDDRVELTHEAERNAAFPVLETVPIGRDDGSYPRSPINQGYCVAMLGFATPS